MAGILYNIAYINMAKAFTRQMMNKICPDLNTVTHSVKTIGIISYNLASGEIGWFDIYKQEHQSCGIGTRELKK